MVYVYIYTHTHTEIYIITQSEFVNQRVGNLNEIDTFCHSYKSYSCYGFILQLLHAFSIKPYIIIIQRRVLES